MCGSFAVCGKGLNDVKAGGHTDPKSLDPAQFVFKVIPSCQVVWSDFNPNIMTFLTLSTYNESAADDF